MNYSIACLAVSLICIGIVYAKQPALPGVLLFGGAAFAFGLGALLFGWEAHREKREKRYGQNGNTWRSAPFRRR